MRKSVVIHRFIRANGSGKERAAAHIRYIQFRPGRDRDKCGEAGRHFFSESREGIQGWRVIERIREQEDGGILVHKFTLSPGINGFDPVDYTREVMGEYGRSKGWDLEYYGTNHGNTEHDHIHMVVMGKDKDGREVWIDGKKDYAVMRELGDRYIEKYHNVERYLDRELHDLIKNGPSHQHGDGLYEQLWKDLNKLNKWGEPEPVGKEPYQQYEDEVQGDAKYRQLIADLTKRKSADDAKESKEEEREEKVDEEKEARRLKLIEETPEEERIYAGENRFYTKHHTLKELEKYDDDLNKGREDWLEYETYQLLWKWIGTKETGGDDYYERTGETERLQQQFDDDFERTIRPSSNERIRSKGYQQYSIESRGRLLETHEHMQTVYFRHQLKEELKELDESGVDEPERRKEILEKLDWLNELSQALREPQVVKIINKENEVNKVKETEEERDDKAPAEKGLSKSEQKELEQWRDGDNREQPEEHDERKEPEKDLSESERRELEQWRNSDEREQHGEPKEKDSMRDEKEELDREEREREERAREEAQEEKEWRDEYDRREREEERARQEEEREEQERQEREGREEEAAADRRRREEQDKEREDDDRRVEEFKRIDEAKLRERDDAETEERLRRDEEEREEQIRAEKQQKDERERMFRLQQELEKLKQQQLEPGRDSKGNSGPSRLQEKIDQYEQEIANGNKRSFDERQAGDKAEPNSLDLAEPTLDLDKGIEENWSLDEKAGPDEHEIDDLLNGLDREEGKDRAEIEDAAASSLFGEEVEKALEQFEKTPEEERIASWEENAFNPELIKDQQERPEQQMEKALLGDEADRSSPLEQQEQQEVQKAQDQQMQQQIQDSVQIHIERAFLDPGREVNDKDDRDQSQDRDEDGRGR